MKSKIIYILLLVIFFSAISNYNKIYAANYYSCDADGDGTRDGAMWVGWDIAKQKLEVRLDGTNINNISQANQTYIKLIDEAGNELPAFNVKVNVDLNNEVNGTYYLDVPQGNKKYRVALGAKDDDLSTSACLSITGYPVPTLITRTDPCVANTCAAGTTCVADSTVPNLGYRCDAATATPGGGGRPIVPVSPGAVLSPTDALYNTKEVVQWIYKIVLPIAVILAVARILLFLISMATSQGDPQKLAEVKDNMYATIVGLIVIAGAVSVVTMLGSAIGL